MMIEVAYWAQNQCSYQAAEDAIFKIFSVRINDDLIRKVTNYIGSIIFNNDTIDANINYDLLQSGKLKYDNKKDINNLYIEIDGSAINTRIINKDKTTWRENKLCVVFNSNNIRFWHDKKSNELRHTINKREYCSYIGSVDIFKKYVFSTALKNGLTRAKDIILINDGATWIRNIKEELFPEAQQILDFFHLSQHLYDFAKVYFDQIENKYKPWVEKLKTMFRSGYHMQAINDINKLKKKRNSDKLLVNLCTYLQNNINNINYKSYIDRGFFIGSGAIESGNKVVLQKRLKGAGMRWDTTTAQTLLTLKSKIESNLWIKDVILPIKNYFTKLLK
jgi:hypothetical protein